MVVKARYFYLWIFTIFLIGLPIMTSYVFVQQEGRSSINIPLLQLAQNVESDLQSGVMPDEILKGKRIDLSVDQSPFITLYSLDKKVLGSSQHLSGETLSLPSGVLDNARIKGQARVTWQPKDNLRFASITDFIPTFGYVSVAQSLQETESRATRGMWIALAALGLGAFVSGLFIWFFARWRNMLTL